MVLLLELPQELLDRIVELVLLSEREPPDNPDVADETDNRVLHSYKFAQSWRYGPSHVLWEPSFAYISNAHPVLTVNKLLYASTKTAIERLRATPGRLVYKLDALVADERVIYPTWTCVPFQSRSVDRVEVTFRIIGADADLVNGRVLHNDRQKTSSALTYGDGSPPQLLWCFYYLLEHTLRCGPCSRPIIDRHDDHQVVIKSLSINAVLHPTALSWPEDVDFSEWIKPRRENRYGPREPDTDSDDDEESARDSSKEESIVLKKPIVDRRCLSMLPTTLIGALWRHFHNLLSMGYHTSQYGALLHERIGIMEFYVEGEIARDISIGEILRRINKISERDTFGDITSEKRVEHFIAWKEQAIEKRIERGLGFAPTAHPALVDLTKVRPLQVF